ncbi:hypothetical protein BLNAU_8021 [Blattamonas nauphoetae]|uniref:Uncharacterized protein n=1 Tax=Blattamonas nauphoetae TaxID=2049346 RepID=A0ABQ9XZN3_9EUKA|nr:hypothetical protein BLNAU_8021 [Blattamonas nauphoetae]
MSLQCSSRHTVFENVDKLLSQPSSSLNRAPRVLRIVLFEPPHSGVRTLSHLLVKRYGVLLIDRSRVACPDDSAASFSLLDRLPSQHDSVTNDYLLVNAPRNIAQIILLQNNAYLRPYQQIWLSVPADELLRRVEEGCAVVLMTLLTDLVDSVSDLIHPAAPVADLITLLQFTFVTSKNTPNPHTTVSHTSTQFGDRSSRTDVPDPLTTNRHHFTRLYNHTHTIPLPLSIVAVA